MEGRSTKPVYDGEPATVPATEVNGGLDIEIESRGILCGIGHARLMPAPAKFLLDDFKVATPPANDRRRDIDASSYKAGAALGVHPYQVTAARYAPCLKDGREADLLDAPHDPLGPGPRLTVAQC